MTTITEPTDPRYRRVLQAAADLKALLTGRPSRADIDGAVLSADDTWKKSLPGMLRASRTGQETALWAEAFESLREARAAVLRMR